MIWLNLVNHGPQPARVEVTDRSGGEVRERTIQLAPAGKTMDDDDLFVAEDNRMVQCSNDWSAVLVDGGDVTCNGEPIQPKRQDAAQQELFR